MSLSVGAIQSNPIISNYEKATNYAKKYVSSFALDLIECFAVMYCIGLTTSLSLRAIIDSSDDEITRKDVMRIFLGLAPAAFGLYYYQKKIKKPFIQAQIEQLIAASQNLPKSIFIINSLGWSIFEGNGVSPDDFSHWSVEKVKRIANQFAIYFVSESSLPKWRPKENTKHDVLLLEGHGSQDCIYVLKNDPILIEDKEQDIKKCFSSLLKDRSIIIMSSCSTAKGDENIARHFSRAFPESIVVAPSTSINNLDFQLDEKGNPRFNAFFYCNKDVTCAYKNGNLLMKNGKRTDVPI